MKVKTTRVLKGENDLALQNTFGNLLIMNPKEDHNQCNRGADYRSRGLVGSTLYPYIFYSFSNL